MMRVRRRVTYSNIIATLALFCALGAGAYAAIKLPRNSVGAKQIRKGAVRSPEVNDRSLRPGDSKGGALAAFAYVRFNAPSTLDLVYGRGARGVAPTLTPGEYDVSFNRKVANCVAHASPAIGSPRGGDVDVDLSSFAGVLIDPDDTPGVKDNVVRAQFYNNNGNPVDTSFVITLFC